MAAPELGDIEVDRVESPLEQAIGSEAVEPDEQGMARLKDEERDEIAEALGKPGAEAARKAAQRALVRLAGEMQRAER